MSTVELLQPQALLGNIQIEAELTPDLPPVSCDEHQIKQVFINIMKNALEVYVARWDNANSCRIESYRQSH